HGVRVVVVGTQHLVQLGLTGRVQAVAECELERGHLVRGVHVGHRPVLVGPVRGRLGAGHVARDARLADVEDPPKPAVRRPPFAARWMANPGLDVAIWADRLAMPLIRNSRLPMTRSGLPVGPLVLVPLTRAPIDQVIGNPNRVAVGLPWSVLSWKIGRPWVST